MESKKIKIALAIALGVFLNLSVALVLAAFIYCGITGLSGSGVTCAAGGAILLSTIDPLFIWIIAWAAGLLVIFAAVITTVFLLRRKKRGKLAAQADGAAGSEEEQASVYEDEFRAYLAEDDEQPAHMDEESADDAVGGQQSDGYAGDELLVKHIRDANEKADEYNTVQNKLTELTQKSKKLKLKAAQIQKHLFKSQDPEFVSRCSESLGKLYKFISRYDERIDEYTQKSVDLHDELTELKRSADSYISAGKIPQDTVTGIEDGILLDIALTKRLSGESGQLPENIVCNVSGDIRNKKDEVTDLEAELDRKRQDLEKAEGDDPKLDALVKVLEVEERFEAACDELGELMCRFVGELPQDSVEEISDSVKAEIVSGSGVVTRSRKKSGAKRK